MKPVHQQVTPSIKDRLQRSLQHTPTAWWVLLALLMLTAGLTYFTYHLMIERARTHFQFETDEIHSAISKRLRDQQEVLQGGVGLFAASKAVDRDEWKAYVAMLNIATNYPGLQGFGYSQVVLPKDREAHIRAVRAEGYPQYQIRPEGTRDLYTAIIYLEPFASRNLRAFGYDMFSEPVRREAMERARDTGTVAISGRVRLVQETEQDVQHGFLMYLPVYRNGRETRTVHQRRSALQGYVYSPFRMNDLMHGILSVTDAEIDLAIHDGTVPTQESLMFRSTAHLQAENSDYRHQFSRSIPQEFGGHHWLITFGSRPGYVPSSEKLQPYVVGVAGLLFDAVLFLLILNIARRRQEAETLAMTMTEEVRAGAVRMQKIVNTVVDGIITINDQGVVESMNPAAERIFGYPAGEVIGRNISMLMPEPYRSQHDDYLARYKAGGPASIIGKGREVAGLRKSGGTFPLDLAVSEMWIGGERRYTGVVRDITDRKKIDQMKSEFVSTVSHELRTPLTSIKGSLGILNAGVAGDMPDKARELVAIAYKNSERLTRLINDILDIEKIESGRMQFDMKPYNLMALIDQSITAYRSYGEQYQVRFVVTDSRPEAEVRVDAERFMQVMANLLSNAAKFSPTGSSVEIAVSPVERGWRIAVTDHGPGIPDEFRERIFGKFSQADSSDARNKGGSGLGLSIAKSVVERLGGTIGFESASGQGAVFQLVLPRHVALPSDQDSIHPKDDSPCVLVCEDDADIAQVMSGLLRQNGFHVEIAPSAEAARDAIKRRHFDVMTLDLRLPGEDGISLIRSLRADTETRSLPIVVVSAIAEEGHAHINGGFGVVDWLGKPFDEQHLMRSVERAIQFFRGHRPRILHVEDDADVRRVVASLADNMADFEYADTVAEARARLALERFSLVILDIALPDGSGWELLQAIERLDRPPPVMVFSGSAVAADQARQVAAALVKSSAGNQELVKTIRSLLRATNG